MFVTNSFPSIAKKETKRCQLSDSDLFSGHVNFSTEDGALYKGIKVMEPDFKAANFAKAIEDRKLNGSVLRDFEVASEISCQFECISEERCLSYNFLPIHGKEISICQLSDLDRFISSVNFTKEDGAIYRGIQVTILNYSMESSLQMGICEK